MPGVTSPKYLDCLKQVFKNTRQGSLSLRNSEEIQTRLGWPDRSYKTIHVGGTNGKGSVCTKIARALEYSGLRTGLFLSPHINSIRERISINSQLISESEIHEIVAHISELEMREPEFTISFFELMAFSALEHFKRKEVDVAVVEVGLGGRLDATNVITPDVSVITNVSLDHVRILGGTVQDIAQEKAGIIKPNIPTVIGPGTPLDVMEERAAQVGAFLHHVPPDYSNTSYDVENQRVASRALELFSELHPTLLPSPKTDATRRGLLQVPPCRMDHQTTLPVWWDPTCDKTFDVILDAGHNAAGVKAFLQRLRLEQPQRRYRVVFGMCQDKAVSEALSGVSQLASAVHFVKASSSGRAAFPDTLAESFRELPGSDRLNGQIYAQDAGPEGFIREIQRAAQLAAANDELLVVFGSFFILAEARPVLGIDCPVDPISNRDLENLGSRTSLADPQLNYPYPLV